jgi:hypothetical protein
MYTYLRLGLQNVVRVIIYRLALKLGIHRVQHIKAAFRTEKYFLVPKTKSFLHAPSADSFSKNYINLFGWYRFPICNEIPNWNTNVFTGQKLDKTEVPWWTILDFDPKIGDIKLIWENSRFDWLLNMSQRARVGDVSEVSRINDWLTDWCYNNPPYLGINWKCAQEASIRVLHVAIASLIIEQANKPCAGLIEFIQVHLRRIAPTMAYAKAQNNNHGTSEAAALFVGGTWCYRNGISEGKKWAKMGRLALENRVGVLIENDGSFSQYSVNYHRLLVDTLSVVEVWRRHLELALFSKKFYNRAQLASQWLRSMVVPTTGDAPNIGLNDGSNLLPITKAKYRDYRPCVQLATALFENLNAYPKHELSREHCEWLGIIAPNIAAKEQGSKQFDDGGFVVMKNDRVTSVLKYPRNHFRPCHCDALHLDLWLDGINILRDGGTFSYNTEEPWQTYFSGTSAHNTIQFDDREQMPRLKRFLFGKWLNTNTVTFKENKFIEADYKDWKGATHKRRADLLSDGIKVIDYVQGFREMAVLRWRLAPGAWHVISKHSITNGVVTLTIKANQPITRFEIVEGWESRQYHEKTPLPVLEVEIKKSGIFSTELLIN